MLAFFVFVIIPAIGGLVLAFFEWDLFGVPVFVGLDNIARMFSHPRYVIKGGELVLEDGEIREAPQGREFLVKPDIDPGTDDFMRPLFEDCYTMSFENYPVEIDRFRRPEQVTLARKPA